MSSTPQTATPSWVPLMLDRLTHGEHCIPLCRPTPDGQCGCGWSNPHHDPGKQSLGAWKDLAANGVTPRDILAWGERYGRLREINIGTLIEPSGWLVIDTDSPAAQVEAERKGLPPTLTQHTRKGRHYIYRLPPGTPTTRVTQWGDSRALDILASGYIVAAPSRHASGHTYLRAEAEIAEAPAWAVEALHEAAHRTERMRREAARKVQADIDSGKWPELEEIASALDALDADMPHHEWLQVGMSLHHATYGSEAGVSLWERWSSFGEKFVPGECRRRWSSFTGSGVTKATLFGLARDAGWTCPDHLRRKRDHGMRIDARSAEPVTAPRDMTEPAHLREAPPMVPPEDGEHGGGRGGGAYPDVIPFDSHVALAQIVADVVQGDSPAPLVADEGALWRYGGGLWEQVDKTEVSSAVQRMDRMPVDTGRCGEDGMPVLRPLKLKRGALVGIADTVPELHGVARPGFFADAPRGVAFLDGLVQVEDGGRIVVQPPRPEHRARVGMPWAWDAHAECPEWSDALEQWMMPRKVGDDVAYDPREDADAKSLFLQEFVGAALLGLGTRYQRCALLLGEGANGKSVFLKTIERLFPVAARCAISPQQLGARDAQYYLAGLSGRRLNVVTEMPEADILHAESFKAVITGDAISARHPSGRPFMLTPEAAHVFAANALPRTRDHSVGFWRRFVLVEFPNTFTGRDADPDLEELLAAELEGICAWAIQGAARLVQRGRYTIPPSSAQSIHTWQSEADPVGCWLDDRTTPVESDQPADWTRASALWVDFKRWTETTRQGTRMTDRTFYKRLTGRVEQKRRRDGKVYRVELRMEVPV